MTAQGQPVIPEHTTRMDGVTCFESPAGALGPTNIMPAGNSFSLVTELGFDGTLDAVLMGKTFTIRHHWQNIETGAVGILPVAGGTFTVGTTAGATDLRHIRIAAGPYTTADSGGAADLVIPAPNDTGSFRITTHVHPEEVGMKKAWFAFNDGLIVVVTKP